MKSMRTMRQQPLTFWQKCVRAKSRLLPPRFAKMRSHMKAAPQPVASGVMGF